MKRAAPGFARVGFQQRFDTAEHFPCGAIREREQQDSPRRDAEFNQPRHAIRERPRLARTRARNHQQRPAASIHNRTLFGIQLLTVVDERSRARLIRFDDEGTSHCSDVDEVVACSMQHNEVAKRGQLSKEITFPYD